MGSCLVSVCVCLVFPINAIHKEEVGGVSGQGAMLGDCSLAREIHVPMFGCILSLSCAVMCCLISH